MREALLLSGDVPQSFPEILKVASEYIREASKLSLENRDFIKAVLEIEINQKRDLWQLPVWLSLAVSRFAQARVPINLQYSNFSSDLANRLQREYENFFDPAIYAFLDSPLYSDEVAGGFFIRFPVLFIRLVLVTNLIVDNHEAVVRHLSNDAKVLQDKFKVKDLTVKQILHLPAESHDGQKLPMKVVFVSGEKVVHKPRALSGENRLAQLGEDFGREWTIPLAQTINRDDYGWMEWVEKASEFPPEQLLHQIGLLTAASQALNLVDLFCENVILTKKGICVVDAEAQGLRYLSFGPSQFYFLSPSPLETGILPTRRGLKGERWWDASLCGATPGVETMVTRISYRESDDKPELVFSVIDEADSVVAKIVADNKSKFGLVIRAYKDALVRLRKLRWECTGKGEYRYIYRPTGTYARTLFRMTDFKCSESFAHLVSEITPYGQDAASRKLGEAIPINEIIGLEWGAMLLGDVPRITSRIFDGDSWRSQPILEDKSELVHLSFGMRFGAASYFSNEKVRPKADRARPVSQAKKAEKFLATEVLDEGYSITWGARLFEGSATYEISKLSPSIYDGEAGLALLFGVSNLLEGKPLSARTMSLLSSVIWKFKNHTSTPNTLGNGSVGAIYSLGYLLRIGLMRGLHLPEITASLREMISFLPTRINTIPQHTAEILEGISGWLLTLLSLPVDVKDSSTYELEKKLIHRIVALQLPDGSWENVSGQKLCGFSHGVAGIRYTLCRALLSGHSKISGLLPVVQRAAEYESRNFCPVTQNWLDWRFTDDQPEHRSGFSAWCHGAAGIALAELDIHESLGFVNPDRVAPVANSLERHLLGDTTICCGSGVYFEIGQFKNAPTEVLKASNAMVSRSRMNSASPDNFLSLFNMKGGVDFLEDLRRILPYAPSLLLFQ